MATKDQRAKLLELLNSQDIDAVRQGVELFVALDDDALWDEVLDGATFDTSATRVFGTGKRKVELASPGRLIGTSFFRWNSRSSRWDELALRMLVAQRDCALRDLVVGLDVGGMVTSKEWLPVALDGMDHFPNLTELVLFPGIDEPELAPLGALPTLRRLTLHGAHAYRAIASIDLPSMPNLEYLNLTTRATVTLGDMPVLAEAVVSTKVTNPARLGSVRSLTLSGEADESLVAHCPDVEDFTCTDLWSPKLTVPNGARLVNGSLKAHEPRDLGNLATLSNLQLLELAAGVDSVDGLETLADCVDLRVLDIRGHGQIDDVSFLESHPNLRMIAAHDTGITKHSIPASMKNIVSFAAKPDLRKALDRPAPGEARAKPAPSKLSPAKRKTMSKLKKLLQSSDMASIMQAVELTVALDDPLIWAELLDGVGYQEGGGLVDKYDNTLDVVGRLIPNKIFTGTLFRQPWLDLALAHLVARSPSPVREQVTHLAIGQWSYSTSPLGVLGVEGFDGFTNLRHLQLLDASSCDLSGLAGIAGLEALDLQCAGSVPSHARLQRVTAKRPISFEPGGTWPALTEIDAKQIDDLAPLANGAPSLARLTIQTGEPGLKITGFEKLTHLSVTGGRHQVSVDRCPALEEIMTETLHHAELLPSLRRLTMLRADSLDFLANLPGLEHLTIRRPLAIDRVDIVTGAKLDGPLRLTGVRDLGNVAELDGLQILQLLKVDEPLSLEPLAKATQLRVLDVRGCAGVTDLSPLEGLPQLRMVAARDSGVEFVPASLGAVVSRTKVIDLEAAAAKSLPTKSASKKKIPVPEAERSEWELVLAGLATSDVDVALAAIDRAAALDHGGLDFLLSKISVLRDQLRSRAPFRLSTRVLLPPVVARILSHLPADSVAAAPFRRMTKLVVEGEARHARVALVLDGLEAFVALDELLIHKCGLVRGESIEDSAISVLAVSGGQVTLGALPPTLRQVLLEGVSSLDLAAFALDTIDELRLLSIVGDVDLGPLTPSPPKKIRLGHRYDFQKPIVIPPELEPRCAPARGVSFKSLL